VELMGGVIGVESEPGKGSVFTFTFKAKTGEIPQSSGEVKTGETPDFSGRTVLLAEDVEINQEIVIALLEPTHMRVVCAADGQKALDLFTASPDTYDAILMDVQMPIMDGYEASRKIRQFEAGRGNSAPVRSRRIPIIAMTANVFKEDIERCLEAGMDGHLGKPLDFGEVLKTLQKVFSNSQP
jgi:CheY-like chemotaxis protein